MSGGDPPWRSFVLEEKGVTIKSRVRDYAGDPITLSAFKPHTLSTSRQPPPTRRSAQNGFPPQEAAQWAILAGGAIAAAASVITRKRRKSATGGLVDSPEGPAIQGTPVGGCGKALIFSSGNSNANGRTYRGSPSSDSFTTSFENSPQDRESERERKRERVRHNLSRLMALTPLTNDEDEPVTPLSRKRLNSPSSNLEDSSILPRSGLSYAAQLGEDEEVEREAGGGRLKRGPSPSSTGTREDIQKLRQQLRSREEIIYELQAHLAEREKSATREMAKCSELEAALRTLRKGRAELASENARLRKELGEREMERESERGSGMGGGYGEEGRGGSRSLLGYGVQMGRFRFGGGGSGVEWGKTDRERDGEREKEKEQEREREKERERERERERDRERQREREERERVREREKLLQQELSDLRAEVMKLQVRKVEDVQYVREEAAKEIEKLKASVRRLEEAGETASKVSMEESRKREAAEKEMTVMAAALDELAQSVSLQASDMEAVVHPSLQDPPSGTPLLSTRPYVPIIAPPRRNLWRSEGEEPRGGGASTFGRKEGVERGSEVTLKMKTSAESPLASSTKAYNSPLAQQIVAIDEEEEGLEEEEGQRRGEGGDLDFNLFSNPLAIRQGGAAALITRANKNVRESPPTVKGVVERARRGEMDGGGGSGEGMKKRGAMEELKKELGKLASVVNRHGVGSDKSRASALVNKARRGVSSSSAIECGREEEDDDVVSALKKMHLSDSETSRLRASPVAFADWLADGKDQKNVPQLAEPQKLLSASSVELKQKNSNMNSSVRLPSSASKAETKAAFRDESLMEDNLKKSTLEVKQLSASVQLSSPYVPESRKEILRRECSDDDRPPQNFLSSMGTLSALRLNPQAAIAPSEPRSSRDLSKSPAKRQHLSPNLGDSGKTELFSSLPAESKLMDQEGRSRDQNVSLAAPSIVDQLASSTMPVLGPKRDLLSLPDKSSSLSSARGQLQISEWGMEDALIHECELERLEEELRNSYDGTALNVSPKSLAAMSSSLSGGNGLFDLRDDATTIGQQRFFMETPLRSASCYQSDLLTPSPESKRSSGSLHEKIAKDQFKVPKTPLNPKIPLGSVGPKVEGDELSKDVGKYYKAPTEDFHMEGGFEDYLEDAKGGRVAEAMSSNGKEGRELPVADAVVDSMVDKKGGSEGEGEGERALEEERGPASSSASCRSAEALAGWQEGEGETERVEGLGNYFGGDTSVAFGTWKEVSMGWKGKGGREEGFGEGEGREQGMDFGEETKRERAGKKVKAGGEVGGICGRGLDHSFNEVVDSMVEDMVQMEAQHGAFLTA